MHPAYFRDRLVVPEVRWHSRSIALFLRVSLSVPHQRVTRGARFSRPSSATGRRWRRSTVVASRGPR